MLQWPEPDPAALHDDVVTIVVQVNGRVRDRIRRPAGATSAEVVDAAVKSDKVRRHLDGKTPRIGAFVPDRLLNLTI